MSEDAPKQRSTRIVDLLIKEKTQEQSLKGSLKDGKNTNQMTQTNGFLSIRFPSQPYLRSLQRPGLLPARPPGVPLPGPSLKRRLKDHLPIHDDKNNKYI